MKQELKLTFHGLAPSESLSSLATELVSRLERVCDDIVFCRVSVAAVHHHDAHAPFNVRIELKRPGQALAAVKAVNEDAYAAMREAFDDMTRLVKESRDRQRQRLVDTLKSTASQGDSA